MQWERPKKTKKKKKKKKDPEIEWCFHSFEGYLCQVDVDPKTLRIHDQAREAEIWYQPGAQAEGIRFGSQPNFHICLAVAIGKSLSYLSFPLGLISILRVGIFFFFLVCFVLLFRVAPAAYGGSQARGPIGAVAAGLHQSHSNAGSELRRRPTPQLMATPDP